MLSHLGLSSLIEFERLNLYHRPWYTIFAPLSQHSLVPEKWNRYQTAWTIEVSSNLCRKFLSNVHSRGTEASLPYKVSYYYYYRPRFQARNAREVLLGRSSWKERALRSPFGPVSNHLPGPGLLIEYIFLGIRWKAGHNPSAQPLHWKKESKYSSRDTGRAWRCAKFLRTKFQQYSESSSGHRSVVRIERVV